MGQEGQQNKEQLPAVSALAEGRMILPTLVTLQNVAGHR